MALTRLGAVRRAFAPSLYVGCTALVLAGCSCTPRDGAVRVEVKVVGLDRGCLRVTAADAEETAAGSSTTVSLDPSAPGRTYTFGVVRQPEWSHSVKLDVAVHERDCAGPVVATGGDASVEVPADTVVTRSYTLNVDDADGDGYVALSAGGTDCSPNDGTINPGAAEVCGNTFDDDCDTLTDCADSACAGLACDDGNACTVADTCGATCAGTAVVCNTPPGVCFGAGGSCVGGDGGCAYPQLAAGTSCDAGMVCSNSGNCVPQDTEFDCTDGVTNDSDALVDCADPDCLANLCDAGLCTTGETCQGNGSCGAGVPVGCAAPANECLDAGVCNDSSGLCSYAPTPAGGACNDNNACVVNEQCNGAGACVGAPMTCNTPGACEQTTGACDAGVCLYPAAVGQACDDGMMCTQIDVCSATRSCAGASYTCNNPPECRSGGATSCLGDGGCTYPADATKDGMACDAGTCASGVCVPAGGGPFVPSNFDPATVPPSGSVTINCAMTFNSTDGGVTSNWCGNGAPAVFNITQLGSSEPAVVLSMTTLTITDAGTLRLQGANPVILYVAGNATIDGFIDARGEQTLPGAGGNRASCGAQTGLDGGADLPQIRGGGGGGAGFRTAGGTGGTCQNCSGGPGGAAGPADLTPLVGGCRGGHGGKASATLFGGDGGAGGGAVQVTAGTRLHVSGTARISASAGGGLGGPDNQRSGGGGGGSAGGVLLEGRGLTVLTGAAITANGGGGGEAGDADEPGDNGDNGSATSATPAAGGTGLANAGGAGGNGAAGASGPGNGENTTVGGGGGGAAGRIVVRTVSDGGCTIDGGALFSPAAQAEGTCQ